MKDLFEPYTYANKALRTQATRYTGSNLVTDILARNTPLPNLPVFHQEELIPLPEVFNLCMAELVATTKASRKKYLDKLLAYPAEGESAGYLTQLNDAKAFNTEGDNTDSTVLMRIDARLKIDETREEWSNKVLKIKSLYYSYCDAQATGVVRRALGAIELITLSEDWEKKLDSVLVAAKKDKDDALVLAKSYLQSLK